MCVCVCVHACMRACVRACGRACVRARVRAWVRAWACVWVEIMKYVRFLGRSICRWDALAELMGLPFRQLQISVTKCWSNWSNGVACWSSLYLDPKNMVQTDDLLSINLLKKRIHNCLPQPFRAPSQSHFQFAS